MSQSDDILIYAELLSNVKRVSVACDGPLYGANTASASVSPDSLSLTVRNHEIENTLKLPDRVVAAEDAAQFLRVQNKSLRCHEWSLPLASPSGHVTRDPPRRAVPEAQAAATPWSARDLIPRSSIYCRGCQATLVPEGKVETWKDLPSENWAEMMEFWHCHKPHDHGHHDDQALASRGYGANSRLSGQEGVGLVDLTSLLFSQSDCSNVTPSTIPTSSDSLELEKAESEPTNGSTRLANQGTPLSCNNCHCEIGVSHQDQTSVTLFKWTISIRSPASSSNSPTTYPAPEPSLSQCVSAMLMATLSRSACSKTIIIPTTTSGTPPQQTTAGEGQEQQQQQQLLHIWLFNQDITFTSTKQQPEQRPVSAIKVFYRFVNQAEADKLVESMTSDVQDITLPAAAATQLREELERSNGYLPKPVRNFGQWRIGLLEKWKGDQR
ncbi:ubiquitin-conjugating enzyme E2-binding protein [Apiospora arundinis]|uniref:Ubiquitin-conjugating enzyme E2-binding protein n=1 Tax=Apiospora arundinis TaxID=335852 RepID=A0ABR2JAT3_9PEZI